MLFGPPLVGFGLQFALVQHLEFAAAFSALGLGIIYMGLARLLSGGRALLLAETCLALGVIGVIVPGLPSTVFVLMAAWAAARSSPRLYRWLWFHPLFGSMLRNWANGGRVSRHAKWSASVLMALCAIILLVIDTPRWAAYSGCGFMACVLTWLWLRPEPEA